MERSFRRQSLVSPRTCPERAELSGCEMCIQRLSHGRRSGRSGSRSVETAFSRNRRVEVPRRRCAIDRVLQSALDVDARLSRRPSPRAEPCPGRRRDKLGVDRLTFGLEPGSGRCPRPASDCSAMIIEPLLVNADARSSSTGPTPSSCKLALIIAREHGACTSSPGRSTEPREHANAATVPSRCGPRAPRAMSRPRA